MKIGFGKLGKSIKFKGKYSPIGGDCEAPLIIMALAKHNPNDTFYLVGKSDYNKLSDDELKTIFPNNNVINVYNHIEAKKMEIRKSYEDPYIQGLNNYFKDNHIDSVILMVGQVGGVSVPGKTWQVRDTSLIACCIDMTANYTSPITVWLNENRLSEDKNIPIIEVINDPRYTLNQPRDIMFSPKCGVSQFDYQYINTTIKNYDEQLDKTDNVIDVTYNGVEKAFLINKDFPDNSEKERSRKFTVVLNEGKPSRYKEFNKWILSHDEFQDIDVFGKWDDSITKNDERFKGALDINEVQKIMEDTRYTFIIPIKDGWVTSKYIEMIYAGVIPFFHPSYDTQGHIKSDILRVKDTAQLIERINFFEAHPSERIEYVKALQKEFIKEHDLTGLNISNEIINKVRYYSEGHNEQEDINI